MTQSTFSAPYFAIAASSVRPTVPSSKGVKTVVAIFEYSMSWMGGVSQGVSQRKSQDLTGLPKEPTSQENSGLQEKIESAETSDQCESGDLDGGGSELRGTVDDVSDGVDARHGGLLIDADDLSIVWVCVNTNSGQVEARRIGVPPWRMVRDEGGWVGSPTAPSTVSNSSSLPSLILTSRRPG